MFSLDTMTNKEVPKSNAKARAQSPSEAREEDEVYLFKETVSITNDGCQQLDLWLCHVLRIPNLDPDAWWVTPFSSRVARPV